MKRILPLLLCFALGCALVGCSPSTPEASPVNLDASKDLEGMTYKVSSEWQETDGGAAIAYAFGFGEDDDVVCSITVAAMDKEMLAASETDGTDLADAFASILGVNNVASDSAKFEGKDASSFKGQNAAGYDVEGYVVPGGDLYYVLMIMSTSLTDPQVEATWTAFQENVQIP